MSTKEIGSRGNSGIEFRQEDFDVLDLTLRLIPELRICAHAVKRAREANIEYPINDVKVIINLLEKFENGIFIGGGHRIEAVDVHHYLPQEYFPIEDEEDLVSRIYLGLLKCNHDAALVAQIPEHIYERHVFIQSRGGE